MCCKPCQEKEERQRLYNLVYRDCIKYMTINGIHKMVMAEVNGNKNDFLFVDPTDARLGVSITPIEIVLI